MRPTGRQPRKVVTVLVTLLALVALWWVQDRGEAPDAPGDDRVTGSAGPGGQGGAATDGGSEQTDPDSGLPVVRTSDLPAEARDVLRRIAEGGPFKYPRNDGVTFENREELLPDRPPGYYREYTVESGPGDRGPLRIVTGAGDEAYWTDDHYQSFSRISRAP